MTKKEAVQILAILKAAYPNGYRLTQEEAAGTIGVWCMHFANVPADIVLMALNKHISSSQYPPSIHDICSKLSALHWEAYDIVCRIDAKSAEETAKAERVYKATERYRYEKSIEPQLCEMLESNPLQLLGGDAKKGVMQP